MFNHSVKITQNPRSPVSKSTSQGSYYIGFEISSRDVRSKMLLTSTFDILIPLYKHFERGGSIRLNPEGRMIENQKAEFYLPLG